MNRMNENEARSGRWQAPAAVLPEGPKNIGDSHSRARRAREWPKHASPRARRARGRAKLSLRFGACQCYCCFSRFSPKSRFSRHNLSTLMTAKMHENFSRVSYLEHKHRVKKSRQFVDWVKSYARLKFCKNAAFVSKSRPDSLSLPRERTQFC